MYLLDTCVCIEFLRGNLPNIENVLAFSDPTLFALPAIVEAELLTGAEKSAHPSAERRKVEMFVNAFEVLAFDSACARAYAPLRSKLEKSGKTIGPLDMLIAATALAHHATLVTNNSREFLHVEGLHVEEWEEIDW